MVSVPTPTPFEGQRASCSQPRSYPVCRFFSCTCLQHVHSRSWCLPEILPPPSDPSTSQHSTTKNSSSSRSSSPTPSTSAPSALAPCPLLLEAVWPYYLGHLDAPVSNDVQMCNNTWLLTGANMAGALHLSGSPVHVPPCHLCVCVFFNLEGWGTDVLGRLLDSDALSALHGAVATCCIRPQAVHTVVCSAWLYVPATISFSTEALQASAA